MDRPPLNRARTSTKTENWTKGMHNRKENFEESTNGETNLYEGSA